MVVVQASNYSSKSIPSLGTSISPTAALERKKREEEAAPGILSRCRFWKNRSEVGPRGCMSNDGAPGDGD